MSDAPPNPALLPSLGQLVRGLSALFWGVPSTLLVCVYTAHADSLQSLGIIPPLACTAWLLYGLWRLSAFQPQERIWRQALDHAGLLGLVDLGLSPFLFWANRSPDTVFFALMTLLLALTGLLFLMSLNHVLQRLGAMLPDEALRQEINQFTAINLVLLRLMLVVGLCFRALHLVAFEDLPHWFRPMAALVDRVSLLLLVPLVLMPMALTMALLWKTKEVILDSVFGPKS